MIALTTKATETKAVVKAASKVTTFTKEQLINSKKYVDLKDVLAVVLKDGQAYTIKETDDLINKFMKTEVK